MENHYEDYIDCELCGQATKGQVLRLMIRDADKDPEKLFVVKCDSCGGVLLERKESVTQSSDHSWSSRDGENNYPFADR